MSAPLRARVLKEFTANVVDGTNPDEKGNASEYKRTFKADRYIKDVIGTIEDKDGKISIMKILGVVIEDVDPNVLEWKQTNVIPKKRTSIKCCEEKGKRNG